MCQLEKWHEDGIIYLEMTETSYYEASAGNPINEVVKRRRQKAEEYFWTGNLDIDGTNEMRTMIRDIVFPNGAKNDSDRIKQERDIETLLTAQRTRLPLTTSDGNSRRQPRGILGSASDLAPLGIIVLSDEEAVREVQSHIRKHHS